jgi:tetratricopeptide (TPR) repeat protein
MQVRFIRLVLLAVAVCGVAAGCGKYSISNIRSAKAFQDANGMYKKADYQGAVARYEDSVRFNPDLGFAYFFLGNSYDQMYRPTKKGDQVNDGYLQLAAQHYRTAIEKLKSSTDPKEQEIRRYSFEYLIALYSSDKLNDFSKAEPVAKELINVDPNNPSPYQMLARLYEDQGRFEESEQFLLQAIDKAPNESTGYQLLAGFYNRQGEFEKTMAAWNKRAEMEPNNPEAWHTIGVYYQDKVLKDKRLSRDVAKDYAIKGIAAEDKALAINPEYSEAMVYKNILMRHQALYERDPKLQKQLGEDAERLLQRAIAIQKKQTADQDKEKDKGKGAGS